MIELKNISKTYKTKKNKKETKALKSIDYKFSDKGLYFVAGKSGSGKSTLLGILSGIDFSFEGEMIVDNKSIKDFSTNDINYYKSTYIGYIFQDYNLIPELNAYENVKLGFDVSSNENEEDIDEIFKKLDIEELKTRDINELSGGEKQRIAIARCLVKKPKVILADEPTGALDPINSKNIMDSLYELSKEYLVIVVTHNTNYLDEYESKKIYLDHGEMTTSDIENITSDNTYESKKYRGLSDKIKLRLGFDVLFHKKISLIFSLIFIILSLLCISVSISGINYDFESAIYNELKSEDDYIVANYNCEDKGRNYYFIKTSDINRISTYNQELVYGYSTNTLSDKSVNYYFYNYSRNPIISRNYFVFEYDEKSIDLFKLEVIEGNEPVNGDDLLITDLVASYFVDNDYENDSDRIEINSYADLVGLELFGCKICGVVKTKNSEEYFEAKSKAAINPDYYKVLIDSTVDYGCGNAFFTKKKIHDNIPAYFKFDSDNVLRYGDGFDISSRNTVINNVEYFDSYNSTSPGLIVNANFIYKYYFKKSYSDLVQEEYSDMKNNDYYSGYSDEEIMNLSIDSVKRRLKSTSLSLSFTISPFDDSSSYLDIKAIKKIIGVSYDLDSEISLYVNTNEIEGLDEYLGYKNVVAIFSSINNKGSKAYFSYLFSNYKKIENTADNSYLYLVNERAAYIYSHKTLLNILKIIFAALALIFLMISFFIMYKYIYDSIAYKEKDIGVFKSIGVSSKDIFDIFNLQNIFIIVISIFVSVIIQYVAIHYLNVVMSKIYDLHKFIETYNVSFINYVVIISLSVLTSLLATLKPILKFSKKNPKDILNNN